MTIRRHSGGSAFERDYGYARAVSAGGLVFVSGTTADEADLGGDVQAQFRSAAGRVDAALQALGASMAEVVRTVVYVRDLSDAGAIASAHAAVFGANPPASTVVEVARLTPAPALVELEVTAVSGEKR